MVVGAHLDAEVGDRPAAYRLCEALGTALGGGGPTAVVCTDLWYLNSEQLRSRPTVAVGSPSVNALSAYLADKLPSAFVVDGVLMVQFDAETAEPSACCWGVDAPATAAAVDAFLERYLHAFAGSARRR